MKKTLVSRIHKFINKDCMLALNDIYKSYDYRNNNDKAGAMRDVLKKFNVPFVELGPGTNRYAVKIDGYVFKIAFDKSGREDNLIEFSLSEELQPYVAKTYECNELIIVQEYVSTMNKEEFKSHEDEIKNILDEIVENYLVVDLGYVLKNYINWGFRDDQIVMLDYGDVYRTKYYELLCGNDISPNEDKTMFCKEALVYDGNYTGVYCPRCDGNKLRTFDTVKKKNAYLNARLDAVRRRMNKDKEMEDIMAYIENKTFHLTSMKQEFDIADEVSKEKTLAELAEEHAREEERLANESEYIDDVFPIISVYGVPMLFAEDECFSEDSGLPKEVDYMRCVSAINDPGTVIELRRDALCDVFSSVISYVPFGEIFKDPENPIPVPIDGSAFEPLGEYISLRNYITSMSKHPTYSQISLDVPYIQYYVEEKKRKEMEALRNLEAAKHEAVEEPEDDDIEPEKTEECEPEEEVCDDGMLHIDINLGDPIEPEKDNDTEDVIEGVSDDGMLHIDINLGGDDGIEEPSLSDAVEDDTECDRSLIEEDEDWDDDDEDDDSPTIGEILARKETEDDEEFMTDPEEEYLSHEDLPEENFAPRKKYPLVEVFGRPMLMSDTKVLKRPGKCPDEINAYYVCYDADTNNKYDMISTSCMFDLSASLMSVDEFDDDVIDDDIVLYDGDIVETGESLTIKQYLNNYKPLDEPLGDDFIESYRSNKLIDVDIDDYDPSTPEKIDEDEPLASLPTEDIREENEETFDILRESLLEDDEPLDAYEAVDALLNDDEYDDEDDDEDQERLRERLMEMVASEEEEEAEELRNKAYKRKKNR